MTQTIEKAQIGKYFNDNYKIIVAAEEGYIYYLKTDKIILKLKRPYKYPTSITDIENITVYRYKDCSENDIFILIEWFSKPYVSFKNKTLEITNFERLNDEFDSQLATIGRV